MNRTTRTPLAAAAALLIALAAAGCSKAPEVAVVPPATPAPADTPTPAPTATANVSDMDVTEHVKTALLQTESLKGADITVVTTKGDVRLTGTVQSQAQKDEALKVARAAEGMHTIHDELTIRN